jgi:hypothetical protein
MVGYTVLNNMFDTYFKKNYIVVDYHIKTLSLREHNLTWTPYGYHKILKSMTACRKCMAIPGTLIEARPSVERVNRTKLNFDTDSYDILIEDFCSHTLINDLKDYIDPPVKSAVRVRGCNGSTNSTMVGTVKWKIKDDNLAILHLEDSLT